MFFLLIIDIEIIDGLLKKYNFKIFLYKIALYNYIYLYYKIKIL